MQTPIVKTVARILRSHSVIKTATVVPTRIPRARFSAFASAR
ncbi:Uncharacterised protein [Amycolatopsis camponoti]|uniref:Uncharacterized protein n=1 Tax=Amycolatopsis camponoti TaxID=2606593 RepID=A0A6I8LV17_9PSEU|nr:Uncharacterised protein [Amycolatopsis camponoti]